MKGWLKILLTSLSAILVVWLVWALLVVQLTLPTRGEEPVLYEGDRVLVSRVSYGLRLPGEALFGLHRIGSGTPRVGEFIAFNDPIVHTPCVSSKPVCVGCCTALPGDTVWMSCDAADAHRAKPKGRKMPFIVPGTKVTIDVKPWNLCLLLNTLRLHEGVKATCRGGHTLLIDGRPVRRVRFTQDYYWVHNAHNPIAYDSRIFGFVPATHLIGRLLCISYSKDPLQPFYSGYRYNRFFMPVKPASFYERQTSITHKNITHYEKDFHPDDSLRGHHHKFAGATRL